MPPRLHVLRPALAPTTRHASLPSFLVPFVHQTIRASSILSSLSNVPSSYSKRIRRGRGPASGKGKTAGRGHKGQKQHGKVPAGFTGGQTPEHVVKGKRGFENKFALNIAKVNIDRLQDWIDQGRLDNTKPITVKELHESRCTHGIKDGVKLLGRDVSKLRSPVNITVSQASESAIAAIEANGGTIQTRYYTKLAIRRILKGEMHPTISLLSAAQPSGDANEESSTTNEVRAGVIAPKSASSTLVTGYKYRLPDPASRRDLEYYRDPGHRGYLSYQLKENEGPSLFFKKPRTSTVVKKAKKKKGDSSENQMW